MDIQFYGANCIVLSNKQVRIVIDDNLADLGGSVVAREGDICLFTQSHPEPVLGAKMTIDTPGEYEVSGVNIYGLQSRSHTDTDTQRSAVMYKIVCGDVKILVTGHVYPKLSEAKLEDISIVDVMLVPVGGNGYTLDPTGALQIVKQVEPKIVIPTHYDDRALKFEVPQQTLEEAVKVIGFEPKDTLKKLQFKPSEATDTTQLIVLEKS
jgi:L-ascorbate metabolism protein UlaG (beta-lactamase superfamily)